MKKIIFVLFLVFILSGCSTTWYINKAEKICPECFKQDTNIINKITKRDTVIYVDSTFLIPFNDSLNVNEPIKYKDSIIYIKDFNSDTIIKTKDGIEAKIWIKDSSINATFKIDSTLEYQLKDTIRIKDAIINNLREVVIYKGIIIEEQEKELKWYEKVLNIGKFVMIGLSILIVVAIIIKIVKWIKK